MGPRTTASRVVRTARAATLNRGHRLELAPLPPVDVRRRAAVPTVTRPLAGVQSLPSAQRSNRQPVWAPGGGLEPPSIRIQSPAFFQLNYPGTTFRLAKRSAVLGGAPPNDTSPRSRTRKKGVSYYDRDVRRLTPSRGREQPRVAA